MTYIHINPHINTHTNILTYRETIRQQTRDQYIRIRTHTYTYIRRHNQTIIRTEKRITILDILTYIHTYEHTERYIQTDRHIYRHNKIETNTTAHDNHTYIHINIQTQQNNKYTYGRQHNKYINHITNQARRHANIQSAKLPPHQTQQTKNQTIIHTYINTYIHHKHTYIPGDRQANIHTIHIQTYIQPRTDTQRSKHSAIQRDRQKEGQSETHTHVQTYRGTKTIEHTYMETYTRIKHAIIQQNRDA